MDQTDRVKLDRKGQRHSAPPRVWAVDYGDVSLDFVNTRWLRLTPNPAESVDTPGQLITWLHGKSILDGRTTREWFTRLRRSPQEARKLLREAVALREALYHIYWALAHSRRPRATDIGQVNRILTVASRPTLVMSSGRSFATVRRAMTPKITEVIEPIALAALTLLTEEDLARLRHCSRQSCGVVFFDRTKNASRRWCDMARCGALTKMRVYRHRVSRGLTSKEM